MNPHRITRSARPASLESLESRRLFAVVSVNAAQTLRAVDTKLLGVNIATWDFQVNTTQTRNMVNAAGLRAFRLPGGSTSDGYHFNVNTNQSLATMASMIASQNGVGMATVNYGTGSPQEGAAMLAYLNGSTSNATNIGIGQQWNGSSWVNVDWKTASFWATLRTQSPISPNDGLNFLRIGRAAPFAFHYFEIGNEIYGSWETDMHGSAGDALPMPGAAPRLPHDPTTYISFSKQFATLAQQIDPSVSIGIGSQATDSQFNNWITNILIQSNAQGFVPGYISDHVYMQGPGAENDAFLMGVSSTVSFPAPANPMNFPQRAIKYRTLVNQNLSAPVAANVELLVTEFNSVYGSPGKQITSLVNGLFLADALGSMLTTEYNGAWAWDLHNGPDTGQNNSSSLYGWRNLGDYGIIGTTGTPPATGLNVPYPNYFAEQLASKLIQSGGSVVQASSNDVLLATYAVREADGHLKLLVINKSKNGLNNDTTGTPQLLAGTFNLSGFYPASQAQVWQFGSVQDNIAKNSTNGLTALTNSTQALSLTGQSSFSYSFPSLSMTVLDLTPAAPQLAGGAYPFDVAPNRVQFTFNQDVSASLSPSDLVLTNLGGGSVPAVQSVAWDAPTLTATFTLAPGIPQDGNYRATLPAASVTNALGTPLATDATFDFFVLAGDANRDRSVNLLDFNILAQNFGQSGRLFSQGDFTYDATVDLLDFNVLANKFGQSVGPGTFAMTRIGADANPTRVIDELLGDALA